MDIKNDASVEIFILEKILDDVTTRLGQDGRLYVSFDNDGQLETQLLHSRGFQNWLWKEYIERNNKQPPPSIVAKVLERYEQKTRQKIRWPTDIIRRCHGTEDEIYFDLGDGKALCVDGSGREIQNITDLNQKIFVTNHERLSVCVEERPDVIEDLGTSLSLSEDQISLVFIWLLCCLRGIGPFPILALIGEENTLRAHFLRNLIDPQTNHPASLPNVEKAIWDFADPHFVSAFCDIETLSDQQAQTLARIAKGCAIAGKVGAAPKIVFSGARPIVLAGSEDILQHHALASRALVIDARGLPFVLQAADVVAVDVEDVGPGILAWLFDIVCGAKKAIFTRGEPDYPDPIERWLVACEQGSPSLGNRLTEAYRLNRAQFCDEAVESNPLFISVRDVMQEQKSFRGTARELLELLDKAAIGTKGAQWPKSEEQLAKVLRKNEQLFPELQFRFGERKGKKRERQIVITLREGASEPAEDAALTAAAIHTPDAAATDAEHVAPVFPPQRAADAKGAQPSLFG